MSDAPETTFITWPQPGSTGLAFSVQDRPPARRTKYTRSDLCITRAEAEKMVQSERERCAIVVDAAIEEGHIDGTREIARTIRAGKGWGE